MVKKRLMIAMTDEDWQILSRLAAEAGDRKNLPILISHGYHQPFFYHFLTIDDLRLT